ncbi:MAG: hypothetical protein FWE80_09465 [Oscillospiraceae bacterium]|nr:hypothetical protein [Oscillospiraceae bacterium]
MYIYPSNLKARATLFLWRLKDVVIGILLIMLGAVMLSQTGSPVLLAAAAVYALLSIRFEENSVLDYMKYAFRFCVSKQQLYVWRCPA